MTTIDGNRDRLALTERVATALDARHEGKSWAEAAIAAGYSSKGACWNAVMEYMGRRVEASVSEFRAEANQRTAKRMAMLNDMVTDFDLPPEVRLRAHSEFTRLEARHARLNGMDAPIQVALSAGVVAELHDALEDARALIEGEVLEVHDERIEG